MAPINDALAYVGSLRPSEHVNYTQIAKLYNYSRITLFRRHREVQKTREAQYKNLSLFNNI